MTKNTVKIITMILSVLSLTVILVSAGMVFGGTLDMDTYKLLTFIATIVWFITSPFWMIKHDKAQKTV